MRHYILTLLLLLGSLTVSAQEAATTAAPPQAAVLSFGYFSYKAVMEQMPEYATAQRTLSTLRAKYDAEMKRVEDEFNMKYEQFLEGQHDFAPSILQKRQAELQDLMQKNQAFKSRQSNCSGKPKTTPTHLCTGKSNRLYSSWDSRISMLSSSTPTITPRLTSTLLWASMCRRPSCKPYNKIMNKALPQSPGPIGIFDSGYGGLTILHGIRQLLPQYDYLYLGDNARAPTARALSKWSISSRARLY